MAQLRQRYPTTARISFIEADASCAKRHEANITAASLGKPYVGAPALASSGLVGAARCLKCCKSVAAACMRYW